VTDERVVPYHCPYCGEEDLRPGSDGHGTWECNTCMRAFSVKFVGLIVRPVTYPSPFDHGKAE
jgi:hypothetical protein